MNWWDSISSAASRAWGAITDLGGLTGDALGAQFRMTSRMFTGAIFQLTHPLNTLENNAAILAGLVSGNMTAVLNAVRRLEGWNTATVKRPIVSWTARQFQRVWASLAALRRWVEQQIDYAEWALKRWTWRLVAKERHYRILGDKAARAYARQQAKWAIQVVNREAESGYRTGQSGRVSTVTKLLDAVVVRDPILRDIVGKVVTGVLDLAAVEDPVARLVAGFVLREVVDKLGIDRAMGVLLQDLLGPLLGDPQPHDLHDVIMDICTRLDAVEGEWATFMTDGGPQILQAGQEWRNITSLITDAGLLAFAVAAVADPAGVARDLSDIIRPVGTHTIEAMGNTLAGR